MDKRIHLYAASVYRRADKQTDIFIRDGEKGSVFGDGDLVDADDRRQSAAKKHSRERDDKGLQLHIGDEKSLNRSEYDTEQQHEKNRSPRIHPHVLHGICEHHTHKTDDRTDGNIDAAGDHDDRHT